MLKLILKRDGSLVPFELDKIATAIAKSFQASDCQKAYDKNTSAKLADEVVKIIQERDVEVPTVEFVQDIVEEVLIEKNYIRAAKAYILYREKRSNQRKIEAALGSSFEQLENYKPKNSFYNSPKDRARILGETSLVNYNRSNHFDCFVTKALEQKILTINNMAYLDDLIYQYVIDCDKIDTDDCDVALNKLFQVVLYFDKFQQGPVLLCNFANFVAGIGDDAKTLKKLSLVFDNLELFLENRLEIEGDSLDGSIVTLLTRTNISFENLIAKTNVVYHIMIDVNLLDQSSVDLGIDLAGLENRLQEFLNSATRQLFEDSLKMLGAYKQYLAGDAIINQLDLINSNDSRLAHQDDLLKGFDVQLNIAYK